MTSSVPPAPERRPNRLLHETSPYLLQHAYNPVDWYPWGEEALTRARQEDRPIFLSIGYSACHWCHVMERESFEDPDTAAVLNEHFVCIKVDREERPDLDEIYMTAVQLMTGQGGWPMSVFLTPTLLPFFGGTYFPPGDRYGRPGFRSLCLKIAEAFRTRREEIDTGGERIRERIASYPEPPEGQGLLTAAVIAGAAAALLRDFDRTHGGFGDAPKFPHPMGIRLLLRQYRRAGDPSCLEAATITLDRMAAGGIYDHLGGGFHRYSTDSRWLVPHFEKMLYDQALLVPAYVEAWLVTRRERYRHTVVETCDYVLREMTSPEGAFYSTEDADSEGEEGRFYTWTRDELRAVLGEDAAQLFARAYDVDETGNFEGRSILHIVATDEALATGSNRPVPEIAASLADSRRKLFEARGARARPARDEKILAGWNALAISALARVGAALDEPRFTRAATRAAEFAISRMQRDGRLRRVWKDGKARVPAYLEDCAGLVAALADLYQATFDARWLAEGVRLADVMVKDFGDPEGGFFNTTAQHRDLIVRVKNSQDGSTPSGTSLATCALLRLGRLVGRADLEALAEKTLRAHLLLLERAPGAFHQMLLAADFFLGPRWEIVIAGRADSDGTQALLGAVRSTFLPQAVVLWTDGSGTEGAMPAPSAGKTTVNGRPAAYVCRDFACAAPVTDPEELGRLLRE